MSTRPLENVDYVTFDHEVMLTTLAGHPDLLTIIASYQLIDGREVVELVEAVNQWGEDVLDEMLPHQYEDARATALSLFHCAPEDR